MFPSTRELVSDSGYVREELGGIIRVYDFDSPIPTCLAHHQS